MTELKFYGIDAQTHFCCDIAQCRGICCLDGDAGAPLKAAEIENLQLHIDVILPLLSPEGAEKITKNGVFERSEINNAGKRHFAAPLIQSGACAFLSKNPTQGIHRCALEEAHSQGIIPFDKPISCHLYPLVELPKESTPQSTPQCLTALDKSPQFIRLKMHRSEICKDAFKKGKAKDIHILDFAKEALQRLENDVTSHPPNTPNHND